MKQRGFIFGGLSTYLIAGIAFVVIVGGAYLAGRQDGREAILRENVAAAVKIVREQGAVTERVVTKYVKVAGATKTVTQTVEKEVIKYADTNTGVCLDSGWRRLHDRAADNIPVTTPKPDGEGGAPTAATAIATVTQNYAACHRTADRLDALQQWVTDQQKIGQ